MKLISNINSNHSLSLKNLFADADQAILVSPFLADNLTHILSQIIGNSKISEVILITTLPKDYSECLHKSKSLPCFVSLCNKFNIHYRIYINNKLHGKVYLSRQQGEPIRGIITSANLTDKGMGINHEWGIKTNNSSLLKDLYNELFTCPDLYEIDLNDIKNLTNKVDNFKHINYEPIVEPELDLSDILKYHKDTRFFLKPLGVSGDPFTKERKVESDLHFSKRRPKSVRINDIIICYGVGPTKLLGYFKVLSTPINDGTNKRWPWYVESENLNKSFSDKWWIYNNTQINKLCAAFHSKYPSELVTYNGGKSLGALNFGSDKIRLKESFAKYLINEINKYSLLVG